MSASDAAPLPRLGEVFFDVRGSSRTMRLSWYADTDVAVFSIWQGGMCTGTFRLPMGDLARMIEILQRGPDGRHEHGAAEHRAGEHRAGEYGAGEQAGFAESGYAADYHDDYADTRDGAPAEADYGSRPHDPRAYDPRAYDPGAYDSRASEPGGYKPGEYDPGDYGSGRHPSDGYGEPGYGGSEYRDGGHRDPGRRTEGYEADNYAPGYDQAARAPGPAYWHDDGRYQPDATGQRSALADDAGYGQQRFVPPYVRPEPDSSDAGYLDDSGYRSPADPAARSRHSEGRHSGGQAR
ncbi:MAG TPA: hypothetical protein VGH96_06350 [Streptosporangiaceae bacterium]|jgi:hypothetical protein